jgi:hypothetical protein
MHFEINPNKFNKDMPDEPTPAKPWPKCKRWKIAKRHHMGKFHEVSNMLIEEHFMKIRKEVRRLYAQRNEYFYDKDQREDLTESTVSMHTIACSTFYMVLDCNYCHEYEVEYHIDSSPFKDKIAALISKGAVKKASRERVLDNGMAAHFDHMRSYWNDNPLHFSYLIIEVEQE